MTTTNPPAPGDRGHGPQPGAGREWPADASNLDRPDDSGGGGGVNPAAVRAGHEPDVFAVKPILAIPIAVVGTFVIAIGVATGVFLYVMQPEPADPFAHPEAMARGQAPLNDRLARIDRAGSASNTPFRDMDQPRLEPLTLREADGKTTTRPELPFGNSPQIHPEDIRPDRYPGLQKAGWVGKDKLLARIPIEEAIRLAGTDKGVNAQMFPVRKDASQPTAWADRAQESNGGAGTPPAAPKIDVPKDAAPAPKPADKTDPPKTDAPKAPEKK